MVEIENMVTYRLVCGFIMFFMMIFAIFGNIIIIITLVAVKKKNPGYFLIACKMIIWGILATILATISARHAVEDSI